MLGHLFERSMKYRFFSRLMPELLKMFSHVFPHLKDVNIEILYYNKLIGAFFPYLLVDQIQNPLYS